MAFPWSVAADVDTAPRKVQLYGWDSPTRSWHGPDELPFVPGGTRRILGALKRAPGRSWYGAIRFLGHGEPDGRFFAVVHDLDDCAVAMIYCDDSKAGPAAVIAVVPSARRSRLRPEFPFEFLAFTSFLRSTSEEAAQELHERMTAALAESAHGDSLVFSITTGLWVSDQDYILSRCAEMVAMALLEWTGD